MFRTLSNWNCASSRRIASGSASGTLDTIVPRLRRHVLSAGAAGLTTLEVARPCGPPRLPAVRDSEGEARVPRRRADDLRGLLRHQAAGRDPLSRLVPLSGQLAEHPAAVVQRRQRSRPRGSSCRLIGDLTEHAVPVVLLLQSLVVRHAADAVPAVLDADIAEAAAAVAATLETARKGLIYEHEAATVPGRRLAAALRDAAEGAEPGPGAASPGWRRMLRSRCGGSSRERGPPRRRFRGCAPGLPWRPPSRRAGRAGGGHGRRHDAGPPAAPGGRSSSRADVGGRDGVRAIIWGLSPANRPPPSETTYGETLRDLRKGPRRGP